MIGPVRRPTKPTSSEGSQCNASATETPLEQPRLHHVVRSPGHDLLGRLENQPHPARQPVALRDLTERQPDAEQDRGVHIVTAGVADPGHPRAVGNIFGILERQGVQIRAQQHGRPRGSVTDVAPEPGLGHIDVCQQARTQAGLRQKVADDGCGALFGASELGMGVQFAS